LKRSSPITSNVQNNGERRHDSPHTATLENGEGSSTSGELYKVPEVIRPAYNSRVRCAWPRHKDDTIGSVPDVRAAVHRLSTSSETIKDHSEWKEPNPGYWIPMLKSICVYIGKHANIETKAMQKDLDHYCSKIRSRSSADLRWPMGHGGHWHRYELSRLRHWFNLIQKKRKRNPGTKPYWNLSKKR
jgi:hypothetical protein